MRKQHTTCRRGSHADARPGLFPVLLEGMMEEGTGRPGEASLLGDDVDGQGAWHNTVAEAL